MGSTEINFRITNQLNAKIEGGAYAPPFSHTLRQDLRSRPCCSVRYQNFGEKRSTNWVGVGHLAFNLLTVM